ncbi:predicted protein [Uncinocarpus reesii 1704]|uniref:Galactose oxidase n=1 Tax=Uncinocarpus reesii (strain UAMH 1704) TaxID=336963 RepID=C4JJX9_UNCRE|nr:uncharacterized protein UREG_01936 [Uncinocarpus reesii 1704]EEP77087.1 predicted protein [Uncinocarpus reesii 1704]
MVKAIRIGVLIQLSVGLASSTIANLPYNPSYVWAPSRDNDSLAYILSPKASGSSELRLRALDLSARFDVSAPHFVDLIGASSFLPEPGVRNIVPIPNNAGLPVVYAGDCRSGLAEVWRFVPGADGFGANGTWSKSFVKQGGDNEEMDLSGPNYLAAGFAFPDSERETVSEVYIFGGMCPTVDVNEQSWISSADYSRTMISLRPGQSLDNNYYEYSISSNLSPPVEEAGFSMTPLLPAYSNSSSGKQLPQQSFALLGGHTQNAFLNMSRIALFSLPERSWSYISIQPPPTPLPAQIDAQYVQGIEPRSGHTAVLSPNGDKLVVFGGWVGDISVPAQPQLAILQLGEAYGGSGEWTWSIPEDAVRNLPTAGIFGHGAAMLPGGIMAVVGGYEISGSTKRSNLEPQDNSRLYLFNVTSEAWVTTYIPLEKIDSSKDSSGPLSSPGQKAGLGVGLGVGVSAAVTGVIVLFCARTRHQRAHRRVREQELRNLALGAERPHVSVDETPGGLYQPMVQVNRKQTGFNAHDDGCGADAENKNDDENGGSMAERTGLLVDVPMRGSKRGMHSRTYQPATLSDDLRRTSTFCNIHPIEEGEEYEESSKAQIQSLRSREAKRHSQSSIMSDPFKDPPSPVKACLPPPMIPSRLGDDAKLEWRHSLASNNMSINDIHRRRRQLADKTDRTLSNLSESSNSSISASSYGTASMGLNLVTTQTPAFRSRQNLPLSDPLCEAKDTKHYIEYPPPHLLANDLMFIPQALQPTPTTEVCGQRETGSPFGVGASSLLPSERRDPPIQNKTKAREWVGSVRRALSLAKKPENARTNSLDSNLAPSLERSISSSPTKSFHSAQEDSFGTPDSGAKLPRRAVSTNSSVLRRKKGAKDWDAKPSPAERSTVLRRKTLDGTLSFESGTGSGRSTSSPDTIDYHDEDEDEDWDVEAAAQGRVVQVTFTVPKEKLRVVNAGDGDGLDDDDDDDDGRRSNDGSLGAKSSSPDVD